MTRIAVVSRFRRASRVEGELNMTDQHQAFYRVPLRVFAPGELPPKGRQSGDAFTFENDRFVITDFKSDGSIIANCRNPKVRSWVVPEEWRP
jgi:hypothetical protein